MTIETKQSTMSRQITQLSGATQIQVRGMKSDGRTTHIKSEFQNVKCLSRPGRQLEWRQCGREENKDISLLAPELSVILCFVTIFFSFSKSPHPKNGETILFPKETGTSPSWRYNRLSTLCFCL